MSDFNLEVYSADEISSEGKLLARSSTIIIHEDLYKEACTSWGRARFTLCHELGHFVLHKVFKATLDTQKRRGHRLYEDSEWQADRFASSLLVPRIHVSRFGDAEELTSQCGISRRAAEVRWSQLHTAENEIRLSRSQYTSSQPLKVPTEDVEKHCTNE